MFNMLMSSDDGFWQEAYPIAPHPTWLLAGGVGVMIFLLAITVFLFFWFTKRSD